MRVKEKNVKNKIVINPELVKNLVMNMVFLLPSVRRDNKKNLMISLVVVRKLRRKHLYPLGQEDGDVDNDGDKDSSDKYLDVFESIGRAIGFKKDVVSRKRLRLTSAGRPTKKWV